MGAMAGPFEILELGDGGSLLTTVEKFEEGTMMIHPRDGRPPKVIEALRIWVPGTTKPIFPPYYDLTSQTLIAQLRPLLPTLIGSPRQVKITKNGVAPKARFTVEVV